ncbi:KdsC family phosphatase [Algoriphagus limi]|uniref:3-deoxy-D-manno-octulosonate 8-phosphate phosphatase KdsC n=1 Tax=Algoriphagus limi TaxID=2975273 RepID=A0ABT2G3D6_9BACT|nr:HAD hydrolase family protein [Algoriphagus limi]MCS5489782.1 HAD hydrolase family protein [Algoriphagus limi]
METEEIIKDYFSHIPDAVWEKAEQIKLLITDIDGVMTDGGIIYDNEGMELKKFQVKDGYIVQFLRRNRIMVGAITGRKSQVVENRCEELRFDFHYHGIKDKGKKLTELLETLELEEREVAYIGDDLIDLPIMKRVGLTACPADAISYIKHQVDFVTKMNGGNGAFREVADLLLHAKGKLIPLIESLSEKNDE